MIRYELKKIFSRNSGRMALGLLLGFLVLVSYLAIHEVRYINEKGDTEYGIAAVRKLKELKKEWAGPLDEEKLKAVLAENARINATPEWKSGDLQENETAYGWKQGFLDISRLMIYDYCGFNDYNYEIVNTLKPDEMAEFYPNRIANLEEWLAGEGKDELNEKEKAFLREKYGELETPILYDSMEGWTQFFAYSPMILMLLTLVLGFLCAGIFSCESRYKADSIFYSAYYGRNRAVRAKLQAGLLMVTVIYWAVMLLYSGIVLGILGFDGADCPIQASGAGWKSCYNITNFQEYLMIMVGGYVGCLLIQTVTMLVSAVSRSAMLAVVIPFVLIFLPSFLSDINVSFIRKLLGLLPDQLLQMNMVVRYFNLYEIAGNIYRAGELLPILYVVLVLVIVPVIYRMYRRVQMR